MYSPTDPSMFQLQKQPTVSVSKPFQKSGQRCLSSSQEKIQHKLLKQIFQLLSLRTSSEQFSVSTSTTENVHLSILLSPYCVFRVSDHRDFCCLLRVCYANRCQHFHLIQSGMSAASPCAFLCLCMAS